MNPMNPDPNAIEVAPGTSLHWGLYLRGAVRSRGVDSICYAIALHESRAIRERAYLALVHIDQPHPDQGAWPIERRRGSPFIYRSR